MKIVAFGASNSKNSINHQLAIYAANQFAGETVEILDLNDFNLPIYSVDLQTEKGVPQLAKDFMNKIESSDVLIISLTEHNGTYTSIFKNIFDWVSVIKEFTFEKTKTILLSTSPGPRGGLGVMEAALVRFPFHGADIVGSLCLPFYSKNFDSVNGILDAELKSSFDKIIGDTKASIN